MSVSRERTSPRATRPARLERLGGVAVNASIHKIAAVDRLVPGEIHRPELLSAVAGGKPINVARAASRLGLAVVVVPVVAGNMGSWLGGSLPPGAPVDGYARIVGLAAEAGARSAVDADGELLARAVGAGPWLAKGNA